MAPSAPFELRCEYVGIPLGVDAPQPRFTWILDSEDRAETPAAWQVLVSSEEELCRREIGDYWDSGRTEPPQETGALYQGEPFLSCHQYFWKVRWWNRGGESSPWSAIARFGTAFFDEKDRKGRWIGIKPDEEPESEATPPQAVYARREFEVEDTVVRATVYISGLGLYEFHLNGRKVGDGVLDPPWTDYHKVALYSVFDVTDLIATKNAVGIILGNGRHIKGYGYDRPKVTCRIEIELQSSAHEILLTDGNWRVSHGPIRENGIDLGETYDARLEMPGWDRPGYEDSAWANAVAVQGPPLSSRLIPPLRVQERIRPASISKPAPGILLFDFGQNIKGWARLRARGPEGSEIKLRYARYPNEDGTLNARPDDPAGAADIFILRGEEEETFEPRFTCHDFRTVEVSGLPDQPGPDVLEGCSIHSDIEKTGRFSCSNDVINAIHEVTSRDRLIGMPNMPSGSPPRQGFLRNVYFSAEESMFNFDMAALYAGCLDDIRLSQKEDGSLPESVPPYDPNFYPADPVDGAAYAGLVWLHYLHYEDLRIIHKHYLSLKRYLEFLKANAENHIIRKLGRYGDRLPAGNIAAATMPLELTSTWAYYHDVFIFSRMALLLGRQDDASTSRRLADDIKQAFNGAFLAGDGYRTIHVHPDDDSPGQSSNVLPLYLDMVPEEKKEAVFESLSQRLIKTDLHIDAGTLGARYILDVLTENGCADMAFRLAGRETFPSGGGGWDSWFYKTIAGIVLLEPGWRKFRISPHFFDNLTSAEATLKTIRGQVRVHWEKADGSFLLDAVVPVGSQAEVHLPLFRHHVQILESGTPVWADGQTITGGPGILGVRSDGYQAVISVGSGTYAFSVMGL